MADTNYTNDNLSINDYESEKLPTGLNVLTILTFIGSGFAVLSSLWSFMKAKESYETRDKVMEQMSSAKMPAWIKGMMPDMAHFEEMVTKSYENRIPILLLSLIAATLCIVGAIQMRKRKKQGYLLYIVGELLPFFIIAFFIGMFSFSGIGFMIGISFTVLFILLYTMQRKNLTN